MFINRSFIDGINAHSPNVKLRITVGSSILTSDDDIISASFEFADDSFIGVFPSWKVILDIYYENIKADYRNRSIYVEFGSVIDSVITWIPAGTFYTDVDGQETDEINHQITLTMYDASLSKFNKIYVPTVIYPCEGCYIRDDICNQAGIKLDVNSDTLLLDSFIFNEQPNYPSDATLREIITHYAEANMAIAYVNRLGKLNFKCVFYKKSISYELRSTYAYLSEFTHDDLSVYTHDEIVELAVDTAMYTITSNDYDQLQAEKLYGPINSVLLARTAEGDDVSYDDVQSRDNESIEANGATEIKISDNFFLDNIREVIIDDLLNLINGFIYRPFNINVFGRPDFDPGDFIVLKDLDGNSYNVPITSIVHTYNGGLLTELSTDELTQTKTDYKATGAASAIKRVSIKADKVAGQITLLAEEVNSLDGRIASTEATLESDNFTIKVKSANTDLYGNSLDEISKNFIFNAEGLTIGTSESDKTMNVDEEAIKFKDGETELAKLGTDGLEVSKATISTSLVVGAHKIEKYSDDTTIIRYIGG